MTPSMHHGLSAYREARFNEYDQSELILMMFSGAVRYLDEAIDVAETNKRRMGDCLIKAKKILLEIMSSLNLEESGEVGRLLFDTYSRQYHTLHKAHITDDTNKISLVRNSLVEIGDAWKRVFDSDEYQAVKQRSRKKFAGVTP